MVRALVTAVLSFFVASGLQSVASAQRVVDSAPRERPSGAVGAKGPQQPQQRSRAASIAEPEEATPELDPTGSGAADTQAAFTATRTRHWHAVVVVDHDPPQARRRVPTKSRGPPAPSRR